MSATQQSDRTDAGDTPSGTATAPDVTVTAPDGTATAPAPQRIRAQTVEEALRRARELLGDDAEIIEANRIRRGGIGGFFATELGVEVLAQSAAATVAQPGTPAGGLPSAPGDDTEHAAIGRPASGPVTDRSGTDRPVLDLGRTPLRGRAAWQAASAELAATGSDAHGATAEPTPSSLLEQLLERAAADELAAARGHVAAPAPVEPTIARPSKIFRSWRVADPDAGAERADRPSMYDGDEAVTLADTVAAAVAPPVGDIAEATTTFAEHFLRELMQDAEALRSDPTRRPAPPTKRRASRADAPTLPGIVDRATDADTPPAPPATDTPPAPTATVTPPAPASVPRRRRASRPKPAAAEPQLPLAPDVTDVSDASDVTDVTDVSAPIAPAAPASPTIAINAIVDQCLQLATSGDAAPSKVAVAMTLADGQVVKVTVEMPRNR